MAKNTRTSTPDTTTTTSEAPKKGAADSKRYDQPLALLRTLQTQLTSIEGSLEASAKDVAGIEEERRQEGERFSFDLKLQREKQLAEFAKQDAEREANFTSRENALTISEGDFAELLGVEITAGDHLATGKALRTALEAKLASELERGKKEGTTAAKASYEIAKQVDAANAKTELELLKQKNGQLEARVAELTQQNKALLDAQAATNATVADVAKKGLEAAAGVVQKGNDALGTAAGAYPGGSRSPR